MASEGTVAHSLFCDKLKCCDQQAAMAGIKRLVRKTGAGQTANALRLALLAAKELVDNDLRVGGKRQ